MSFSNVSLFVEALFISYSCRIQLWFNSFKRMSEKYHSKIDPEKNDEELSRAIRRAIRRAERFYLWRNKCLVSTFCARSMLDKRGIGSKAYLGMRKGDNGKLEAHAWIISGNIDVVPNTDQYEVLYEF